MTLCSTLIASVRALPSVDYRAMRESFRNRLEVRWKTANSLLCVGIDPLPDQLPAVFHRSAAQTRAAGVLAYARRLVAATAPHAAVFKPQFAHFAAIGAEAELAQLIDHIHADYPAIPVILDAKRGDIGSTAALYATEAFARYDADAVTVSPFLGLEGIKPFLDWSGRGVIVLCRTSNPGSDWLQQGEGRAAPFRKIARAIGALAADHPDLGLVVGATQPTEVAEVRRLVPDLPLLVPGIGVQGGDLQQVLQGGLRSQGAGLILSVSRGLSQAWSATGGSERALSAAAAEFARQMPAA